MKIGVVAAGGRLGGKLVTEAIDRGHEVTAIIHHSPCKDARAAVLQKDLFDLSPEDVAGFDVLFSAYGSGFQADPVVNRHALNHLAELVKGTEIHLISIAGAGCLFADNSKTARVYELPGHPDFLKGISMNTTLGIKDVARAEQVRWTFVCPGVIFDGEGAKTGSYLTSTAGCVLSNEDGNSYTTYDDLAAAMVDFAEQDLFELNIVTVVSRNGGPRH